MDVSVPAIKAALKVALLLHGCYDIEDQPWYEGESSMVYFGKDWTATGRAVALKFFFEKQLHEREVECRFKSGGTGPFNDSCVVTSIAFHDGDIDEGFRESASNFNLPPYCLVMEQAERNLWEAIGSENLLTDPVRVYGALYNVALALVSVHREGFVHGDVCSKNIVRSEERGGTWKLTDFDGAVKVGGPMGAKLSTAYASPEMITVAKGRPVVLSKFNEQNQSLGQYHTLQAEPSFDIWSYGVLMYGLLTDQGPLLGVVDSQGNLDENGLKKLARWDSEDTLEKVNRLHRPAGDLLKGILNEDPQRRPPMEHIVNHEFFHQHSRYLQHEEDRATAKAEGNMEQADYIEKRIDDITIKGQIEQNYARNPQS